MANLAKAQFSVAVVATIALAGCDKGATPFGGAAGGGAGAAALASSPVSVERDMERPDLYNIASKGLWDGRPSLGGVWVAHSQVHDPERVMIRNTKTGKSVVGALFRREVDNPGPSLQVSSDAADALGMLAGEPAELTVVALRREETPVPADATITGEESAVVAAAEAPATEPAAGQDSAPMVTAATEMPAGAAGSAAVTDAGAVESLPAAEPVKKKRGFFDFLKRKPKQDEAAVAAAAASASVAASAGAGPIEQTTLDPVAASASAALDRVDAAASAPAAPAAPVAAPAKLTRAYIQIGIFSQEANAKKAAEQMGAAGMTATVVPDTSNDKTYWRVIVGPAASEADRSALASRVKGLGYPDAYPVSK